MLRRCGEAVVDLGAPLSIISAKNLKNLKKNLSSHQLENLRQKTTNQKFRFGPDRICKASKKILFPIVGDEEIVTVEIFVIKEEIPTLLGLNFLKPLGSEIIISKDQRQSLRVGNKDLKLNIV